MALVAVDCPSLSSLHFDCFESLILMLALLTDSVVLECAALVGDCPPRTWLILLTDGLLGTTGLGATVGGARVEPLAGFGGGGGVTSRGDAPVGLAGGVPSFAIEFCLLRATVGGGGGGTVGLALGTLPLRRPDTRTTSSIKQRNSIPIIKFE